MYTLINLLQHQLTPEQLKELEGLKYTKIVSGKEALGEELYSHISNTPGDWSKLLHLAKTVYETVKKMRSKGLTLLLPIGSPAFQWAMARFFLGQQADSSSVRLIFAHSERVSIDELQSDGVSVVKRAVFKHSHFYYAIPPAF